MSPKAPESDYDSAWFSSKGYDTAQICVAGHCINDSASTYPRFNEDYCSRCGQPTITACRHCRAHIRGHLYGSMSAGSYTVPAFCHECGTPYPWTETRLARMKEEVGALEGLSAEEREQAVGLLTEVARGGLKAKASAGRFRKLLAKAGEGPASRLTERLIEIGGEPARLALS